MSYFKWIERLFWFWYVIGLLLMLFYEVPDALAFSNGLFLFFYAIYAVTLHPVPAVSQRLRYSLSLLAIGGLPFLVEFIGVSTGEPFGSYAYTSVLGFGIGGVPAAIAAAWIGVIYSSTLLTRSLPRFKRALTTGLFAVILDLVLDPVAYARGFWLWEAEGGFYGVPWSNFAAWFIIGALLSLLLPVYPPNRQMWRRSNRLYQSILLMFGLLALKEGLGGSVVIAALVIGWVEWRLYNDYRQQKQSF